MSVERKAAHTDWTQVGLSVNLLRVRRGTTPSQGQDEQHTCKYLDDSHQIACKWIEGYGLV